MAYVQPFYVDPKVQPIVLELARAAFPEYSGRKFKVKPAENVTLSDTYWDGGTRSSYAAIGLVAPFPRKALPHFNPPQFGGPSRDPVVALERDVCIVEHSIFCGKDAGLTFYLHPDNMARLLPSGDSELEPDHEVVLVATSNLKNTYGGETEIRFREATRQTGITRERWEAAKSALIESGKLRKNGSITPEGRNAIRSSKLRIY